MKCISNKLNILLSMAIFLVGSLNNVAFSADHWNQKQLNQLGRALSNNDIEVDPITDTVNQHL